MPLPLFWMFSIGLSPALFEVWFNPFFVLPERTKKREEVATPENAHR